MAGAWKDVRVVADCPECLSETNAHGVWKDCPKCNGSGAMPVPQSEWAAALATVPGIEQIGVSRDEHGLYREQFADIAERIALVLPPAAQCAIDALTDRMEEEASPVPSTGGEGQALAKLIESLRAEHDEAADLVAHLRSQGATTANSTSCAAAVANRNTAWHFLNFAESLATPASASVPEVAEGETRRWSANECLCLTPVPGVDAEGERAEAVCAICGHEWRRHDPEDGQCDAHSDYVIGVCRCGRDLAWMQSRIADLSRAALAANREARDPAPVSPVTEDEAEAACMECGHSADEHDWGEDGRELDGECQHQSCGCEAFLDPAAPAPDASQED